MQQGRVALDADWNELCATIERRMRAETVDIIGRAVVPKETPNGFKIGTAIVHGKRTLTIGRGRIYVHGLLAENFGSPPFSLDLSKHDPDGQPMGVMAELVGGDDITFDQQPFFFAQDTLPDDQAAHLVYLDVWQREITSVEDERLLEPALGGVDTTTRLQTVWQVKIFPNVGEITCATPDLNIKGWSDKIAPSAGRLSSEAVEIVDPDDPCLLPPKSGYRGLENQLYRVEVHQAGGPGAATFKWSRDNASVATNVLEMPDDATLVVVSVGRDSVLRFSPGDWVEITDDAREYAGLPGDMRKIKTVDDAQRRITLTASVSPDLNNPSDVLKARHTRLRRWDHKGIVRDANDVQLVDLDAASSNGTIPVPGNGAPIILENGCQITFSFEPTGGLMRSGDFWTIAARSANATVEKLDKAPPRGMYHHYCRLAVIKFPDAVSDCRVLWPPQIKDAGCGCTVCITPDSHNSGTLTIYQGIDAAKKKGGTVCLEAGIYILGDKPVVIDGAQSVRIVGQGVNTILWYVGSDAAIVIRNSLDVSAEEFSVVMPPPTQLRDRNFGGASGFLLQNAAAVAVWRCAVLQYTTPTRATKQTPSQAAIRLSGVLLGASIVENALLAPQGITGAAPGAERSGYVLTLNLMVRDNLLACINKGIGLEAMSVNAGDTRLVGNTVYGCNDVAISATGAVAGGRLSIARNMLFADGDGIHVGVVSASIEENNVEFNLKTQDQFKTGKPHDGIALVEGLDRSGVQDCEIVGNRVTGMPGFGIAVRSTIRAAMIRRNFLRGCGSGIAMGPDSAAETLAIEDNDISDLAPASPVNPTRVVGLGTVRVDHLRINSNTIRAVATQRPAGPKGMIISGIDVIGCGNVLITDNDLDEIGATNSVVETSAIRLHAPFSSAQITNNVVRRTPPDAAATHSQWHALLIGEPIGGVAVGAVTPSKAALALPEKSRASANAASASAAAKADSAGEQPAAAAVAPAPGPKPAPPPVVISSPLNGLHFVAAPAGQYIISASFILPFTPAAHAHLGVQGNHFLAAGGVASVVYVNWPDACIFSNNQCFLENSAARIVASITAPIVVAATNVVRGPSDSLILQINTLQHVAPWHYTLLGNITSGPIWLNGTALPQGSATAPDKWKELNERAP
jgi:hypothetical protein